MKLTDLRQDMRVAGHFAVDSLGVTARASDPKAVRWCATGWRWRLNDMGYLSMREEAVAAQAMDSCAMSMGYEGAEDASDSSWLVTEELLRVGQATVDGMRSVWGAGK